MNFVGLDLGGVNSLACVRDEAGVETFQGSAHPERPSCVLLPMVRKEKILAGNDALRNERGSGEIWPPLAMAAPNGWTRAIPPLQNGRILLATVWQQLNTGGGWPNPQWQPPDGLPSLNKPTPTECLTAEVRALVRRAHRDEASTQLVLAIPNQLPEESQESLLGRLPVGTRLVWRSVAAAMSWAEAKAGHIPVGKRLAVMDTGLHGVEVSVFEFRQQEKDGQIFLVPVRRLNRLHFRKTDTLLSDSPAPFLRLRPQLAGLEAHLGEISNAVGRESELLACGPLAEPLLALLRQRFPDCSWPAPDPNAVARGSCLFAWRLARDLPTYLDVLPSLELFTTNRYREPEWFSIIDADFEIEGGREFVKRFPRIRAVRAGTGKLENWLRRSNEPGLRKHTIELARVANSEVPVDLRVIAKSAGGFAILEVSPTDGRSDIFGNNRHLLLNWLEMERHGAMPSGFPPGTQFGWPDTGELFGHRAAFQEFLRLGTEFCRDRDIGALAMLESVATKMTPVASLDRPDHRTGVESDTIPVRSLPCFGSGRLCRFFEEGTPNQHELAALERISTILSQELNRVANSRHANDRRRTRLLIRILGRMGTHSPSVFVDFIAATLKPRMEANTLFAVGRVFHSSEQAKVFFETVRLKDEMGHPLTTPWLRVLDYLLFQRANILETTSRDDLVVAMKLSLASLQSELGAKNFKVKFGLSVRAIARLLRARRHHSEFVSLNSESDTERSLAKTITATLDGCLEILLHSTNSKGVRRDRRARLCELTKEWLLTTAQTGVLGPPDDDESDDGDEGEAES